MPHPPNDRNLQTTIPLLPPRLAPVSSPLKRADKIAIYANLGISQITFARTHCSSVVGLGRGKFFLDPKRLFFTIY